MKYILIGLLLGSTVTSQHDTREACEGRAVLLREKGASVSCEKTGTTINYYLASPSLQCLKSDGTAGSCNQ